MRKTYRRFSTEFKLRLVESFLAGDGSMKGLAMQAGINHSHLSYWIGQHREGRLSVELRREEELVEAEEQIAGLERKVGQLTMELDAKKGAHQRPRDEQRAVVDYLRAGGCSARRGCAMIGLPRSTYYRRPKVTAMADPDAPLVAAITAVRARFPAYGYRRVTKELHRRGMPVNHKRVQRVMRALLAPPSRRRRPIVVAEALASDAAVYPNLRAGVVPTGPEQLWVADLTYVRVALRFVYLAVILDAWLRRVVGYAVGPMLDARLPLAALDAVVEARQPAPGCIHHSDRGTQPEFNRSAAGIEASVGSRGDAYDNALAESVIGLFKTEVIRHAGPWRRLDDVEYATLEWVTWFNTCRLLEPLGYLPPAEFEMQCALGTTPALAGALN